MTDLLQIDGWKSTRTYNVGNERIVEAAYTNQAEVCQKCGVIGNLYKHGTKEVSFRDTPMHGKYVTIKGTVQRYRCRDCGETFLPICERARRASCRC